VDEQSRSFLAGAAQGYRQAAVDVVLDGGDGFASLEANGSPYGHGSDGESVSLRLVGG
jgi:hypothetical protein